jgi:hypothetical protein
MPNSIANILTDREAAAFIGVKNVASIVTKFMAYPEPNRLSVTGLAPKKERFWPVKDLCAVHEINKLTALNRIQKLIASGQITGPLLISRK